MTSAAHLNRVPDHLDPRGLTDLGEQLLRLVANPAGGEFGRGSAVASGPTEARYPELLDALDVAVYVTDAAGRITFYNESAARFWGRRPELGEEWCGSWRLFWPDGRPMRHDECPMAIALLEQRSVRGQEGVAERPDGTRVSFMPYPTPLIDADGELIGAVNVLVDITDRTHAEDALRGAAEALRISNAVKDEFLGLVSHELRTPVTTIYGNARLLVDRGDRMSADDRRAMLSDIATDADRLLAIVENLLLLARLGSGTDLDLEPQVLGHVVSRTVGAFRNRHPGRVVTLHPDTRQLIVEGNHTDLELVLGNLLSNADKYSPADSEIDVVVSSTDREAEVRVLDRGIGLTEPDGERLFNRFYRGDVARARADGLGIGLTVCKRLIEIQGGRIWAVPREGRGSEFGFSLPLAPDPDEADSLL